MGWTKDEELMNIITENKYKSHVHTFSKESHAPSKSPLNLNLKSAFSVFDKI